MATYRIKRFGWIGDIAAKKRDEAMQDWKNASSNYNNSTQNITKEDVKIANNIIENYVKSKSILILNRGEEVPAAICPMRYLFNMLSPKLQIKFKKAFKKGILKQVKNRTISDEDVESIIDNGAILISKNYFKTPAYVIAHELGHIEFTQDSLFGLGKMSNFGYGIGMQELNSNPKKNIGKWGSLKKATKVLFLGFPILIQESNASRRAIKILKDAGASEDQIKQAKVNLDNAYQTYHNSIKYRISDTIAKNW